MLRGDNWLDDMELSSLARRCGILDSGSWPSTSAERLSQAVLDGQKGKPYENLLSLGGGTIRV